MTIPPGICAVTVEPQERYVLIRVSITYFGSRRTPATDVTTHIDTDDALAAVAAFLQRYAVPTR